MDSLSAIDKKKLKTYELLNQLKPEYKKTKYPYSHWTPEKITETQKTIKLQLSRDKKFFVKKNKKIKRGGDLLNNCNIIYII